MCVIFYVHIKNGPGFVSTCLLARRCSRYNPLNGTQEPLDQIAPMRIHIGDQSTAGFVSIIPARPLGGTLQAIEYPPAEFQFEPGYPAKEPILLEAPQLQHSGQMEFVFHHTVFEAPRIGLCQNSQSFLHP